MGSRKHNSAEQKKEANKSLYFAKLNNCPSSPRKMRLVADLVNGKMWKPQCTFSSILQTMQPKN
jgi:ribosomal protein L22